MDNNEIKTFVILGMHRSATSLVAKSMNENVFMGYNEEMLPPAPDNPEGFFENKRFLELNDAILHKAGGNWLEPPLKEAILEQKSEFLSDITSIVNEYNENGLNWGWKDPRTSLTIPLFHEHLINPHYISVFREPLEVAKSLNRRNGISIEKGMLCAKEYNYRIIQFLSEFGLK